MTIQNYHYEWRRRGNKNRYERVNTHRKEEPFRYSEYIDQSPEASALEYLKNYKLTRVHYNVDVEFSA
jgi:hypothetical protein